MSINDLGNERSMTKNTNISSDNSAEYYVHNNSIEMTAREFLFDTRRFKPYISCKLPHEEIEKLFLSVKSVYEESLKNKIEEDKLAVKRKKALEAVANTVLEEGITVEALDKYIKTHKSKATGARYPKYEYNVSGVRKTWNGVGRMPSALKTEIDQGKDLEDFLII